MDNVVINITEIQDNVQITLNECITEVVTDGVTVTGNGTMSNPLVAAGSGDMLRATYDPTNKNADAFSMENMVEGATKKILTSAERTKLNNLSGTNTGDQDLTPYLTSATAAATYQPIGAYLTTISGLNISQLINDSGYITSAALSPYQPILVSGSNIKTINGTSILGAGDITISAAAALSGITAATAANTINNAAFQQEWQWDSLTSGIGLKLSSNSTAAASNTQSILQVAQSGANATVGQTTYSAIFKNTKTGNANSNIAGFFETSGGDSLNLPIYAKTSTAEVLRLQSTGNYGRYISYYNNTTETGRIGYKAALGGTFDVQLDIVNRTANGGIGLYVANKTTPSLFIQNSGAIGINNASPFSTLDIVPLTTNNYTINVSNGGIYRTYTASSGAGGFELLNTTFSGTIGAHIQINTSGVFSIFQSASTTHILTGINLTSTNNVGIGSAPNASAKLDVSSTTQGFAPPEMTATQASAISTTSRKLIIYVTDTNGTFTSAGLWMWTGTTWKLILAE